MAVGLITCGEVEDVVGAFTPVDGGVAQVFHELLVELQLLLVAEVKEGEEEDRQEEGWEVESGVQGEEDTQSWMEMEMESVTIRRSCKKKKKLPNHFAVRTSECSWRATVAPAGWTSSSLRADHTGGWAGGPMAPVVATG